MSKPTCRELLARAQTVRHPHTIDIIFRKDAKDIRIEGDWLKDFAARVERVLALHSTDPATGQCVWCSALRDSPDLGPTAPCTTMRLLDGEDE